MTTQTKTLSCLGLGIFLLLASALHAQKPGLRAVVLHEVLGEVIDASENEAYNIFGDIPGFSAAILYRPESGRSKYRLHVLRNTPKGGQRLVLNLNVKDLDALMQGLAPRVSGRAAGKPAPAIPLYPIPEKRWDDEAFVRKISLHDGTTFNVEIFAAKKDTLVIKTQGGLVIRVPDNQIARMTMTASRSTSGRFYRTDPNDSRLLFAPTGRNLQRGEGYFADYFIFFPTVAYGVTDFLALSGGVSLIPGASSQVVYFAPKLAFNLSPTVSIATGGLYVTIPDEVSSAFLAYAVTTIGKRTAAVTLGIGIPVSEDTGSPLLLLGGELQISNSAKLITENWIFTGSSDTEIAFSGGVRFFGDKIAVDLAMVSTGELLSSGGFPFFPWVDFAVSFGK